MSLESELDLVLDDNLLIDLISLSDADLAAAAGSNLSVPQLLPNGLSKEDEEELLKTFKDEFSSDNHGAGRIVEVTDNLEELEQMLSGGSEASGSIGSQSPTGGATSGDNNPVIIPSNNVGLQSPTSGYSCHICHKETPKHNYYGAQACNSCRAFFRRSVTGDRHSEFKCDHNGLCEINSKSWRACQKCRFQKCLCAGMEVASVFSDSKRTFQSGKYKGLTCKGEECLIDSTSRKICQYCHGDKWVVTRDEVQSRTCRRKMKTVVSLVRAPEELFTLEESICVRLFSHNASSYIGQETMKAYADHPNFVFETVRFFNNNIPVSKLYLKTMELTTQKGATSFYRHHADILDLDEEDQESLLRTNMPLMTEFFQAVIILKNHYNSTKYMVHLIDSLKLIRKEDEKLTQLEESFSQFNITADRTKDIDKYVDLYSEGWKENFEANKKHKFLSNTMGNWGMQENGKDFDETLVTLVVLTMLFSSIGLNLKNGKRVDAIQAKYAHMLHRYLKTKFSSREKVSRKFREALFMACLAREASQIKMDMIQHIE